PYFDVVTADWPGALRRALRKAAVDEDDLAFLATLRRLVAELDDGHGGVRYEGEPTFRPGLAWRIVENVLVVTHAIDEDTGVPQGDVVLSIDGRPALEVFRQTEELVSASTEQHRRFKTLSQMLNGAEGSQMSLKVRRPTGEVVSVAVTRRLPMREYRSRPSRAKVEEVRPGVFCVDLGGRRLIKKNQAVNKLAAAKAVILDLRGYPKVRPTTIGHLTDQRVTSARWNVPVTMRPNREKVTFRFSNWPVEPTKPRFRGKVVFLTDGRAVSYAETYLGI
ncbi:MAG: hypothetical protein GY778_02320, partial [bacterium]|nr:hypothetical protein [bacterium]